MFNKKVGDNVKRLLTAGLGIAALVAQGASMVSAQVIYDPYARDTLLVAPDGSILDYVPEQGEVVITRDRSGRRIIIDRYGEVIATEVPRDGYGSRRASGSQRLQLTTAISPNTPTRSTIAPRYLKRDRSERSLYWHSQIPARCRRSKI